MWSRHRVEHFSAVATAYAKKGSNLLQQVVLPCYIHRRGTEHRPGERVANRCLKPIIWFRISSCDRIPGFSRRNPARWIARWCRWFGSLSNQQPEAKSYVTQS
jgi:hypothetical protein